VYPSSSGAISTTERYEPYGLLRGDDNVGTQYRYTGQREEEALGLYDYGARWYDPALERFVQADTIVPQLGNPQSLNRPLPCPPKSLWVSLITSRHS
jgi:RHS repeat-associated protein